MKNEVKDVVENKNRGKVFTKESNNNIIENRLEDNLKLFNNKEINIIKNNKNLAEKMYLLGILDSF